MTDKQRGELESFGPENVRMKLVQAGPGGGAVVHGFNTGLLTRGGVVDWLAEKNAEEATERRWTLRWAIIAAVAAIAGVLVGVAAILVK